MLAPRRGKVKPGLENDAAGEAVPALLGDDAGVLGCLAVDNVYNVMAYNDPIAYRVNACVDVDYALSLKPAEVPRLGKSWYQALMGGGSGSASVHVLPAARPALPRMPTAVELEVHNFTKEELAERKMCLLNDNGQIDFYISRAGSFQPELLDMLGAHLAYWYAPDFSGFLVTEIGRRPGRDNTLPSMRAAKLAKWKKAN